MLFRSLVAACASASAGSKSNDNTKHVELPVEGFWTRVRFPPPPPLVKKPTVLGWFFFASKPQYLRHFSRMPRERVQPKIYFSHPKQAIFSLCSLFASRALSRPSLVFMRVFRPMIVKTILLSIKNRILSISSLKVFLASLSCTQVTFVPVACSSLPQHPATIS